MDNKEKNRWIEKNNDNSFQPFERTLEQPDEKTFNDRLKERRNIAFNSGVKDEQAEKGNKNSRFTSNKEPAAGKDVPPGGTFNPTGVSDANKSLQSQKELTTATKRKVSSAASKEIAASAGKSNMVVQAAKTATKGFQKMVESARENSASDQDKKGYLVPLAIGGLLLLLLLFPVIVVNNILPGNTNTVNAADLINMGGEFLWPLPAPYGQDYISSHYGIRSDPFGGGSDFHSGIDIAAPCDTPIMAVLDGEVIFSADGWNGGCGNYTIIDHGNGLYTEYMHQNVRAVTVGQRVSKGEVIGYVGTTGSSTGFHLHIGVVTSDHGFDYSARTDPSPFLGLTGN